jgi:hypothetical protein
VGSDVDIDYPSSKQRSSASLWTIDIWGKGAVSSSKTYWLT